MFSDIYKDLTLSIIFSIGLVIAATAALTFFAAKDARYKPDEDEIRTLELQRTLAEKQRKWRFFRSVTIIIGVFAFIVSIFGIEKVLDEIWRPGTSQRYNLNIERIKNLAQENKTARCSHAPESEACRSASALDVFIKSYSDGNRYSETQLLDRMNGSIDNKPAKEMELLFRQINADAETLKVSIITSPEWRFYAQLCASLLVGFALAINFADNAFARRMDKNKVKDIDLAIEKKRKEKLLKEAKEELEKTRIAEIAEMQRAIAAIQMRLNSMTNSNINS